MQMDERKRVIILTDISSMESGVGEPDDTQSLIRFLLYGDEFDVEGLAATYTSHSQGINPQYIYKVLSAVILAVLANALLGELRTMRDQYNNLSSSIYHVQSSVDSQIYGITKRVEEVLKSQNNLTAAYETAVLSSDLAANTVTFSASAAPRTFTGGMEAVFLIDSGSGPAEFPGELDEWQSFHAELTCELTDEIEISVVFITGDVRETQFLDEYTYLHRYTLPDPLAIDVNSGTLLYHHLSKDGQLTWSSEGSVNKDYVWVYDHTNKPSDTYPGLERAEIQSLRIGFFRNQKLLCWLEPAEKPANYVGFDDFRFYCFPELSVTPEPEDVFCLAAVVVDEFGREFLQEQSAFALDQEQGWLTYAKVSGWEGYETDEWSY